MTLDRMGILLVRWVGRRCLVASLLAAAVVVGPALGQPRPPVTAGRVATQAAIGGLGGIALGAAGGFTGFLVGAAVCDQDGYCGLGYAAIGAAAGYVVGASYGAYVVGSTPAVEGSFGWTLAGSVGGFVLAVLAANAGEGGSGLLLLGLPPAGAAAAFQLSRRWREGPPAGAVLDAQQGALRLSMPAPVYAVPAVPGAGVHVGVRLARVRL